MFCSWVDDGLLWSKGPHLRKELVIASLLFRTMLEVDPLFELVDGRIWVTRIARSSYS